jgi:pimeloyl-ACP methyl ester carboxylesterase
MATGIGHASPSGTRSVVVLALVATVWLGATDRAPAAARGAQASPGPRGTGLTQLTPCGPERGLAFANAECGAITVFENRQARQGRQIKVEFVRWRSRPHPASGAVFLLAGGPGASGRSMAADVAGWAAPLLPSLDLVVVDQRGTGRSNSLFCPRDVEASPASSFGHIFDPAWVRQCRGQLTALADVTQYTTDFAADDLDDVRAALGYQRIRIYGGSYGTRLAQAYLARYASRTDAVVLDGVMPMDVRVPLTYAATAQQALDRVFEHCAATPSCRRAHPDLRADFARLLARFQKGPIATAVTPPGRKAVPVSMSRGDFGYAIRGILYSSSFIQFLPDWIGQAAASGDLSTFAQRYWERQLSFSRTFATGLHLSVLCPEDVRLIGEEEIAAATAGTFLGRYVIDEYRAACALWPAAPAQHSRRKPVSASVPTLLISGRFDPVTPPAFAEAVARSLVASRLVVSSTGAHGSVAGCASSAALHVLQNATVTNAPIACR